MTRARRWGATIAGALACLAMSGATIASAASSSTPDAAYWWQPEPETGLVPVPGVPANGLYIASAPSGPQAISAVRFRLADPTGEVRLTLHVSKQEQVRKPGVVGYPATSHWSTSGPQPWSARPSYRTHAKPAPGVFTTLGTQTTMTLIFPASEAASGIVLVPAGTDVGGQSPTFSVSFAPPTAADVSNANQPTPTSGPSTHQPPSPSHHPTPSNAATSHSAGPGPHPTTPQTRPTHGTVPPSGAPSASATSTPTSAATHHESASLSDPDGTTKDVIIGVGALVGALLIFTGWRAARRG